MKTAINAWALNPSLSLQERMISAKEAGFDAIEVNFEEDSQNPILSWQTTESELKEIKRIAHGEGLFISSVCSELHWKYSLGAGDKTEREKATEVTRIMMNQAATLEASSVLVIPGIVHAPSFLRKNQRPERSCEVWQRSCENLRLLAETASDIGVTIGIENVHFNGFLLSPIEMKSFVEVVSHPRVKVHLDIGNANVNGVPQDWILTLAELICAVHLKDSVRYGSGLDSFRIFGLGEVEWTEISSALLLANFADFLIVEQSYSSLGNITLSDLASRAKELTIHERKEKT